MSRPWVAVGLLLVALAGSLVGSAAMSAGLLLVARVVGVGTVVALLAAAVLMAREVVSELGEPAPTVDGADETL